ncbi:uncharacterized protein LOC116294692 [Actinia tenebrosa]|uniref:Uncharacterized protein LOC116294692 n=1 Tax=Actinia tenebrosa TaxID=6105 RepID=A0A6P8HSL5_ACTTE|nr:uncharacterized protein LOC116294692 [Actinia tenebrosa]
MKRQAVLIVFFITIFQFTVAVKNKDKEALIKNNRNTREYKTLRELLGKPKDNPAAAKAIKGTKKTTRLHKICSWKKHMKNEPDEWAEDKKVYDKLICGMYTMKDEYKKHANTAAMILAGKHKDKSYEEQKKYLFDAVTRMAKAAGPLPPLNLKMIGK